MQTVVVKAPGGSSTVLHIVLGARQISALGDTKPGRGGGLAGWRLPACGNLQVTQIARSGYTFVDVTNYFRPCLLFSLIRQA